MAIRLLDGKRLAEHVGTDHWKMSDDGGNIFLSNANGELEK